eukprot:Lankesteria_metandrocarpae@DN2277_c0_g1_i1.p1
MVQRVTFRTRCPYKTPSNRFKLVKTPGRRVVTQKLKKRSKPWSCGDCRLPLRGVTQVHPHALSKQKRSSRTVARVYGGSRCHNCVKQRILRAFLVEEQKCAAAVTRHRKQKGKALKVTTETAKTTKKKTAKQ